MDNSGGWEVLVVQMPFEVGDKVDLRTPGGTVTEGRYTVVRIGRRITIRDEAGNQQTVDEDELRLSHRPGEVDWPK